MATACLFMGWNRPAPGSEEDAYQWVMTEGVVALDSFRAHGYYENREMIGLTPHSGDLNGFVLLLGDRARLDELRRTDEFERFSMQMNRLFLGYGVVPGVNWAGIQSVMERNPDLLR